MEYGIVPIGLDIGSLNTRVAFLKHQKIHDSTKSPPQCKTTVSCPPVPIVITNSSGSKVTKSFSLSNYNTEKACNKIMCKQSSIGRKGSRHNNDLTENYLFGDVARRELLNKGIKKLNEWSIRYLLSSTDGNKKSSDFFFRHLIQQTCDYIYIHPSSLRIVISVPDNASKKLANNSQRSLKNGLDLATMDRDKYLCSSGGNTKNKSKSRIKPRHYLNGMVNLIGESPAICVAHGLLSEKKLYSTTKDCRNVLVLNWGESSLTITNLSKLGSSNIFSIHFVKSYESLSGSVIKSLLAAHISEVFESKNRLPLGTIMKNTKARIKVEAASCDALRALGKCFNITIVIDGLYDGVDLRIQLSRVRIQQLFKKLLQQAELIIKSTVTNKYRTFKDHPSKYNVVLTAGNVIEMPAVKYLIDSIFPLSNKCWRGRNENMIPPDQAVSLGCSIYASTLVSNFYIGLYSHDYINSTNVDRKTIVPYGENDWCMYHLEKNVALCPSTIALGSIAKNNSDKKNHNQPGRVNHIKIHDIVIGKGTPLPVQIIKNFNPSPEHKQGQNILCLLQINNFNNDEEKYNLLAKIESVKKYDKLEFILELTIGGVLSLSLNGCPIVLLS